MINLSFRNWRDNMIKITYENPIFVLDMDKDILMVSNEKYLQQWLDRGFKIISEKEARKHPLFSSISDLV